MPRRRERANAKELAMGGAIGILALGTAASSLGGASQLTIILGMLTAAAAAALAVSRRKSEV